MIRQIKIFLRKRPRTFGSLFLIFYFMTILTIRGNSTLTITNQARAMTDSQGKSFSPDELNIVFWGKPFSQMEVSSLATPLQRVFTKNPKVSINIPLYATQFQVRSLFNADKKAFASSNLIPIEPSKTKNAEFYISGPVKIEGRSELLVQVNKKSKVS